MAVKLMTPTVRAVLYETKQAQDLLELLNSVQPPSSFANEVSSIRNQMNKSIANLRTLGNSKIQQCKEWTNIIPNDGDGKMQGGCCCTKHKFDRKLLHYERTLNTATSRLKDIQKVTAMSKNEIADNLKDKAIATAKEFADSEIQRLKREYNTQFQMYTNAVNLIKGYYKANGNARKDIDYKCDSIDSKFEECQTLSKNIQKHIIKMTVQSASPATVGACTINPAYSIVTMLINICTILSMIIRLVKLISQIIDDIQYFFPFFDYSTLSSLMNMKNNADSMMKDANKQAESIINEQKNTLTPVYSLKYNKTTMKWEEDRLNGKIRGYKRPSKINVSKEDVNGISVITNAEIETYEIYRDANGTDKIGDSVDGLIYEDGSIKSQNTASVSITSDGKHSILSLDDGRKITIDKIVSKGDVVKLNDGSIINIS